MSRFTHRSWLWAVCGSSRRTPCVGLRIDDFVRLTQDIPELSLNRGDVGVVRSTWFAPSVAYEVEFHKIGNDYQSRALLMPEQVEVEEGSLLATSRR